MKSKSHCSEMKQSNSMEFSGYSFNLKGFGVTAVILTLGAVVGGSHAAVDDTGRGGSGGSGGSVTCPRPLVQLSKTSTFHKK